MDLRGRTDQNRPVPPMPSRETAATVLGACGIAIPALLAAGGAAARPGGPGWACRAGCRPPPSSPPRCVLAAGRPSKRIARGVRRPPAPRRAPAGGGAALGRAGSLRAAPARAGPGGRRDRGRGLGAAAAPGPLPAAGVRRPRRRRPARTHARVGPEGDEPHYLMVAESLLRDGDLSLERDYAEGRYAVFHDAPLAPHFRVRGKGGEIYSLHAVGLSVLILPAWALAGYAGVTVFMALLAALVALEVREWVRELTGRDGLAEAAGWVFALSPPLVHYAGLVFTEVPAALALSFGLRHARRADLGPAGAVAVGLAAAALPWLNVRYAPLAVLVVAHALWRHPRARVALAVLAPTIVSAAGLLVYHQALYGFWDPRRVYGRRPEFALSTLAEGLPGLLLDQEFGLLVYAPVLALALPGFAFLWRRDRRLAIVAACGGRGRAADRGRVADVAGRLQPARSLPGADRPPPRGRGGAGLGPAGAHGGRCAPPRLDAVDRPRRRVRPAARPPRSRRDGAPVPAALRGPGVDRPPAGVRAGRPGPRTGSRPSGRWRSWPRCPGAPGRLTARRVAVAGLGLVLAAQAAAAVTHARTDDRDAVRLVGRPAVRLPGWRAEPAGERGVDAGSAGLGAGLRAAPPARRGRGRPPTPAAAAGRYRLVLEGDPLSPERRRPAAGGRAGPRRGARSDLPDPAGLLGLGGGLRRAAGGAGGQLAAPGGRADPLEAPEALGSTRGRRGRSNRSRRNDKHARSAVGGGRSPGGGRGSRSRGGAGARPGRRRQPGAADPAATPGRAGPERGPGGPAEEAPRRRSEAGHSAARRPGDRPDRARGGDGRADASTRSSWPPG